MRAWEEITDEIQASCDARGIEWYELRNEVVNRYVAAGHWPEEEGLGSSDGNHILVGEWESDRESVLAVIDELRWRKDTLAKLRADGVDLEKMAELFR